MTPSPSGLSPAAPAMELGPFPLLIIAKDFVMQTEIEKGNRLGKSCLYEKKGANYVYP
jgi:hypothetical protein